MLFLVVIGIAIWFLLVIGALVICISDLGEGWTAVSFVFVLLGGFGGFIALGAAFHSVDPEKKAELELRSEWAHPRPANT